LIRTYAVVGESSHQLNTKQCSLLGNHFCYLLLLLRNQVVWCRRSEFVGVTALRTCRLLYKRFNVFT